MAYVICEPCEGILDGSCVEVCPEDCIYRGEDQFYIRPEDCTDCDLCREACLMGGIFPEEEVPPEWTGYADKAREFFRTHRQAEPAPRFYPVDTDNIGALD